ncbi:MAG: VOC family protein [Blastocatellia bacterium]
MPDQRPKVISITPCLIVSDLQRSLTFYCEQLGFREPAAWGEPPCFAMLNRDEFDLMLSLAATPEQIRPNGAHGVWDFYLRVDDALAEAAALRAAGIQLTREPCETEYGMIEIEVTDPDGYRICFGSARD